MIIQILIATMIGAYIYRMRGGLPPKLPRPIDQILFSLPYGFIALIMTNNYMLAILVLILTTLALLKGHGNNMDLGSWKNLSDYEWYEVFFGYYNLDPGKPDTKYQYWYDFGGLMISGLTYTIPCGLITLNPFIALSGALKAPAYALGWKFGNGTATGEWLTGGMLWGSLALIYYSI